MTTDLTWTLLKTLVLGAFAMCITFIAFGTSCAFGQMLLAQITLYLFTIAVAVMCLALLGLAGIHLHHRITSNLEILRKAKRQYPYAHAR